MLRYLLIAAVSFVAGFAISAGCQSKDNTPEKFENKSIPAAASTSDSPSHPPAATINADNKTAEAPAAQPQKIHDSSLRGDAPAEPSETATAQPAATPAAPPAAPPVTPPAPPPATPPAIVRLQLFKDWPKPRAVLVITGMQIGYIEPCGCSGKENQKGGLSRRDSFLRQLAADGWPVLAIDVGNQVRRFGKQAELKFLATVDALKLMHYAAIGFGPDDLRLPVDTLTAAAAAVDKQASPFVSANVGLFGFDQKVTPRWNVVEVGKVKIGITAVLGDEFQKGLNNTELEFKPAQAAVEEVLPQLEAAHCDHLILVAQATLAESVTLAKRFPQFDFVITAGGAAEPPAEPQLIVGTKTRLVEVGQKGMYANVIGLFGDPANPIRSQIRFQKVPLDARFADSERMKQVMVSYQDQLKELGLSGLGISPVAHPSGHEFVGSQTCAQCHTKAFAIWEKTPHAKSLDTLRHLNPPRNFDPECLACHVTGWEPQKYYPFKGAFLSLNKTPQLAANGCENCHGPGSAHVAAEMGNKKIDDAELAHLRAAMRIAPDKIESTCTQCHDSDNSLFFNFKTYWPKVEHKGKD